MMDELFALFEKIGLPYFRQGSLADDAEYPPSFFTFWNIDTPSIAYRDNAEKAYSEIINVCFYTNDASLIYSQMDAFISKAKAAGFIVTGRAHDTATDEANFYGRAVRIQKIKRT